MKLFTIPNIITLGNLFCGCLAIVFAFNGNLVWAAYLVGIAAVLDFLDGFVARALKQHSPIGKDLDSLADMVTFGVVPGVVLYHLMRTSLQWSDPGFMFPSSNQFGDLWVGGNLNQPFETIHLLPFTAFLVTLFSALRLAKFNNDTRQSDSFIGVPTPASSILICSIPLILYHQVGLQNFGGELFDLHKVDGPLFELIGHADWTWHYVALSLIMSYLLISEIPLFALKFKSFKLRGNELRYSFLAAAVVMMVLLKFIALPLIIVLYILLSVVNNLFAKKNAPDSSTAG